MTTQSLRRPSTWLVLAALLAWCGAAPSAVRPVESDADGTSLDVMLPGPLPDERVEPLIARLRSPHEATRLAAARGLGELGVLAGEAAPPLLDLLMEDHSTKVRDAAMEALARIGSGGRIVASRLVACLASEHAPTRFRASVVLGAQGGDAHLAVPRLASLLAEDPSELVRRAAARALARVDPSYRQAAPRLVTALRDEDAGVREAAREGLEWMGLGTREVLSALFNALRLEERRGTAAHSSPSRRILGRLEPSDCAAAAPLLLSALADSSAAVRAEAVRALGRLEVGRAEAAARARALLGDPSKQVRAAAHEALGRLAQEPPEESEEQVPTPASEPR